MAVTIHGHMLYIVIDSEVAGSAAVSRHLGCKKLDIGSARGIAAVDKCNHILTCMALQ